MSAILSLIILLYELTLSFVLLPFTIICYLAFLLGLIFTILKIKSILLSVPSKYFQNSKNIKVVTFVHPGCSEFGGGEKVLWTMIQTLINMDKNRDFPDKNTLFSPEFCGEGYGGFIREQQILINLVCKDNVNFEELNEKLKQRFNINIKQPHNLTSRKNFSIKLIDNLEEESSLIYDDTKNYVIYIRIVPMVTATFLRPQKYLTMLIQILSQFLFAVEIVSKLRSDIYIDTQGYPFMYPILKFFGNAKVSAYTHYPFISEDMISQVKKKQFGVHSRGVVGYLTRKFAFVRYLKITYYKLILVLYKEMGFCLEFDACNSTWTKEHMEKIWTNLRAKKKIGLIYPPCNIKLFDPDDFNSNRKNVIVSLGQFRPEKKQKEQLEIFSEVMKQIGYEDWELHIIGGVRNAEDEFLFNYLNNLAQEMGIGQNVKFIQNASVNEIANEFKSALIGLHTMEYEHFGITIVEMMAAGIIVVTHDSAGAQKDIIVSNDLNKGFLVSDFNGYVDTIREIIEHFQKDRSYYKEYSLNAINSSKKFSEEAFIQRIYYNLPNFLGE